MPQTLRQALDNAKLVKFHPELDSKLAVWNGGHTVNFYFTIQKKGGITQLDNYTCINVGSFEKDSATRKEVKEGIENQWEYEDNQL